MIRGFKDLGDATLAAAGAYNRHCCYDQTVEWRHACFVQPALVWPHKAYCYAMYSLD